MKRKEAKAKTQQQEKNTGDFEQIALCFNSSATNAIIKQDITPYRCSHIHGKQGQIIESITKENAEMFNSAWVSISDDAGNLHSATFSETEWNFQSIGEGMFSVQTLHGVEVYDEYVDRRIGCYDNVSSFVNGLAVVEKDGKFGIIGKAGQKIVPIFYKNSSYKTEKGEKVDQFEVLNGVVVAVDDNTIDVYSKHGEKLYATDKNGYFVEKYSESFSRRFITYLSRLESLREIYNDLTKGLNKYDEATINRLNTRIDASIERLILSLGSVKRYDYFIKELIKVRGREEDKIYNKVREKKYKVKLEEKIESWRNTDFC